MKLTSRLKNAVSAFRETADLNDPELLEWLGTDKKRQLADSEVTYYTCLKMLSETMGKLPLKLYQTTPDKGKVRAEPNRQLYLASVRPNSIMTPSTFWASAELNTEHYGNGYVWMRRDYTKKKYGAEYEHKDWWVLPSKDVMVYMDDVGVLGDVGRLYYQYVDQYTGKKHFFSADEVMHFKTWMTYDGIMGKPVRKILSDTVDGSIESQNVMNGMYKNGLTASMALQYMGDLDEAHRLQLQNKYQKALAGSKNAGKIVPVPVGLTLTPLKMTLADSQFFELRKYSALQIAAAFGIKPNQINNYEKSSYSNSESQQLAFLVDTMMSRLKQYEEEINYKALTYADYEQGLYMKFNEKALLRTDSASQMNNLVSAVGNGIYTPNEARDMLDRPFVEGGDTPMVNGTFIPLTMVGQQYGIEQKEGE